MRLSDFLEHITPRTPVVAANHRLARELGQLYALRRQHQGETAWETPLILHWPAWLERCWQALLDLALERPDLSLPVLLSPVQEQALWERIVGDSSQAEGLLQTVATARAANLAWQMLGDWRLSLPEEPLLLNEDSRAFQDWSNSFQQLCASQGWLNRGHLSQRLADAFRRGELPAPATLWLAGFDELTPAQNHLMESLTQAGCRVERVTALPEPDANWRPPVAVEALDNEAELRLAARWARGLLEEGRARRVGIVVPNLDTLRPRVIQVCEEILRPGAGRGEPAPYNLSLGRPLSAYPLVQWVLSLLGLASRALPATEVGGLLRAPFLAGAEEEFSRRALLDARLRDTVSAEVTARQVLNLLRQARLAGEERPESCPLLLERWETWLRAVRELPRQQLPSAWAESFSQLPALLGWPDQGRTLDSGEYQILQAWRKLLASFATLDTVWPPLPLGRALGQLRRLAQDKVFQPHAESAPIQILGEVEATGLRFDALWVMGLRDDTWPPPPRPNPFLPLGLQQKYRLPKSSAEGEFRVAENQTRRLSRSAPRVVLSYPAREGDRDLRPSPLLNELPRVSAEDLPLAEYSPYWEHVFRSAELELIEDTWGPPLETYQVRGGSALFKKQAGCPFQAFAAYRLSARALTDPTGNFAPLLRGELTHRLLENLWRELRGHRELLALSPDNLEEVIQRHVAEVVANTARHHPELFSRQFSELEQQRLQRLLGNWLKQEKQRAPFRVVALEEKQVIRVAELDVETKLDRMDELEDGGRVLMDYKTGGQPSPGNWLGERPEEPQLPLYSLPLRARLSAVVFACLAPDVCRFKGLGRDENLLPGIKQVGEKETDWENRLDEWQRVLENLAREYRSGYAAVDPAKPHVCRHCPFPVFCRVAESETQTAGCA